MENIVWNESFNIGVEIVDKAHAKLFRILKKLIEVPADMQINQQAYKEGIKYLEAYSMTHFAEEEAYMRSIRYSGYAGHKRIHDNFRDKTLVALKRDLESTAYSVTAVQRFVTTMNNWLVEHIMREDQAIVGKAGTRKNYDFSAKIPIISKAVNKSLVDAFQTEAKLVSANYKGQNIGNGFYARQFYDTESGIRAQFLLGAEETLIHRGASRILGAQMMPGDEIPKEVLLQIFDQLFEDLSRLFRVETKYELTKDNLLTKDEFRTEFMKGYPYSILYATKAGYFVFCCSNRRIKKG